MTVNNVYESPADFPAVTICNLNPFDGSKESAYNYTNSFLQSPNNGNTYSQKLGTMKSQIYADDSRGASFMNTIGFDLSTMLVTCQYNGNDCGLSSFITYVTYDKGNCYIFNFKMTNQSIQTSNQAGQFYGLQLELFSGFDG